MDQLGSLMQSALARRLAEHLRAARGPDLSGVPGVGAIPGLEQGLERAFQPVGVGLATLGLAREGVDYGAKTLTGALAVPAAAALDRRQHGPAGDPLAAFMQGAGGGMPNPLLVLALAGKLGLPSPYGASDLANTQQAFDADQGNVVAKLRAANEGLARESPLATGIVNQLTNPLTYVTGGGTTEARALQQSGRISRGLGLDLNTVNTILYPEGHLLGKASSAILGPAVRGVLDRTGLNEILRRRYDLPVAPEAGDLARYLGAQGLPIPAKVPNAPSDLAPEGKPDILRKAKENVAQFQRDMGLVKGNAPGKAGPPLPPLQDVPLPPEFGPKFPEKGNVRGMIGPLLPPEQGPALPTPPQDIADLLGAARRVAQPNRLEQLLGAARDVAGRPGAGMLGAGRQASDQLVRGGQLRLPPESGVVPADRARLGLHPEQFDFLDELRATVRRGDPREIAAARDFATTGMEIPPERVASALDEAYRALADEDRTARLAALESSPYFEAFPYFQRNGALRPVNPTTGRRIPGAAKALEQVWNLPGSGYDEVADGILARAQAGGHNQNYGQGTDDFWRGAQESFREYQALRKPAVQAALSSPQADPLGLMREVLKSGDNGKGMIYAPADPAFWQKRAGVDPAAVPGLLRQLRDEGSLAPDHTGDLLNTYLTGEARATPAATKAEYDRLYGLWQRADPAEQPGILARMQALVAADAPPSNVNVAPDLPGGSLDLPAMSDYPNMTRAEAIGNLTPAEVGQLAQLAYRNEKALKYAMASHPDPVSLANAALDRITKNRTLLENLGANYPDLAGKVAYLPEPDTGGGDVLGLMARLKGAPQPPEERAAWQARYAGQSQAGTDILAQGDRVAGSAVTQADLNAMSPEERMAALRKLAGTDQGLAPQAGGSGGGNVLDWLLKSPVQGAPQISRLGIAGSGGVIGAAAGGLAPAEDEDQRRIHALQGAAVGAGLGLGTTTKAGQNIISSLPVAKEFTGNLIDAANVAQREAMNRPPKGIANFTNLANSWRVQQTSTVRNLLQDELTARLWNSNAGVRQRMMNDNWSSLVQLYNLGKTNGYDALPMQTTGLLDKWGLTGYMPSIGAGFNNVNESLIKDLSAADMAKMEAIFAGLNPAQGGVPLAGVALGAVKGFTRAWQEKIFSTLNEFTRLAARHAAFQDEFAPAMQVAAHDFVARHGATGVLDPAAGFSAADVGRALGQRAQDEWAGQVEKVTHLAERRALDIHGDFTRKTAGENKGAGDLAANLFNTVVPFSSWALKAYPRTAAMMLDHPGVSLAIMLLTMGQAEKVQREGKAGLVGGVPIDANTPLVGGIAKKMLGNFPGQAYVNLLGSLTPISSSALLSADQPVNANLYQQAGEALDRAGFSFNPLIQAAAYATNKDYQRPAPLSRTAGLEMALPGPDMPSLALGPLNAARKLAGGSEQHTTAEDRKLAELFYLSTGHQIGDPSNVSDPRRAALLASTLDPHSPIRRLAAESTGQANVARNLVSLVSPVGLQAAPRVEQQAQAASYAARHAPPANYDPRTINALMNSGNMAQYIEAVMRQRANAGTQGEVSPLLQLTGQSSGQDRASMYLQALGASSIFGSPLVGAPQSLINQLLGLSTPSVEIGGPQGGQR